jgi:hypothetical protein
MSRLRAALLAAPLALLLAAPASGQIDDRLGLSGGYEFYAAVSAEERPRLLAARNRADLLLTFGYDGGRIAVRPRLAHDARTETLRADLREAFADLYLGNVDLRIGHQIIVWGRTDGAFVTDLLAPLDLSEFLAQPFDDLRLAVTAASGVLYVGDFDVAAVLIPRRPTSRIPEPGSPWFPAPENVLGVPVVVAPPPSPERLADAAEIALRLTYRGLPRTDVAVLWMSGFNRIPAFRKGVEVRPPPAAAARIVLTPAYARRQVLGLSAETLALEPLVVRAEAAFHSSRLFDQPIVIPTTPAGLQDPAFVEAASRGFLIERPYLEAAVGVERSFGMHTLAVQGIARWVIDHDERVAVKPFEPAATVLWLARLRRETITARAFALVEATGDFWVNPEVTYNVQDGLNVSLGAQVFGGPGAPAGDLSRLLREPAFRFSTFSDNSLGYLRLSYRF